MEQFKKMLGHTTKCDDEDPKSLLMNPWRYPGLTIHGIEGAYFGPKTVILGKVIGKGSIE